MNCPNCGAPMELFHRRRYFFCRHCGTFHFIPHDGPGNVVIDTCRRCDAVWLDSGELTQIVDAPGRDRRS